MTETSTVGNIACNSATFGLAWVVVVTGAVASGADTGAAIGGATAEGGAVEGGDPDGAA